MLISIWWFWKFSLNSLNLSNNKLTRFIDHIFLLLFEKCANIIFVCISSIYIKNPLLLEGDKSVRSLMDCGLVWLVFPDNMDSLCLVFYRMDGLVSLVFFRIVGKKRRSWLILDFWFLVFPDNWTIKNFLDIGRIDIFGINQLLDQKYSLLQGYTRAVLPFFNTMVITPAIVKKLIQVWENYVFNVLIC